MNLLWIAFVFVVLFYAQAITLMKLGFKKLSYKRKFNTRTCYEGDTIELVEEIGNKKPLPLPWVRVESQLPKEFRFKAVEETEISNVTQHKSFFYLGVFKSIMRRHTITCTKRGFYPLGNVHVTIGDTLGIMNKSKSFDLDSVLLVYPKRFDIHKELPTSKWQGDMIVKRWILEDKFLINGIREYETGDNLREVHWKASAKTGQLHVKTHDYTAFSRLVLYLNMQTTEDQWDQIVDADLAIIEDTISYIAYISQFALSQGLEVGFFSNACLNPQKDSVVRVSPDSGLTQFNLINETLARLELFRKASIVKMLEDDIASGMTGMDIILFTNYCTEYMHELIARLQRQGNKIKQISLK